MRWRRTPTRRWSKPLLGKLASNVAIMMGVTRQGRVSSSRRWRSSQFIVLCQAPQLTLCKWWVIPLPCDACLIPGFAWHLYWRITKCTCTKNISWFAWWWNGQVGIHWIWLVLIFSRPHIYFLKERWKRFDRENVDAKLIKFADIFIYLYFIKQSFWDDDDAEEDSGLRMFYRMDCGLLAGRQNPWHPTPD